jgi:hypothetical protein
VSSLYAMRRANGDWFALEDHGSLRVPVFLSSWDGMLARAGHSGMLLFKPTALDARSLGEFVPAAGDGHVYFWLVDNPFTNLKRGRPLDHAQLALLVHDAAPRPPARSDARS